MKMISLMGTTRRLRLGMMKTAHQRVFVMLIPFNMLIIDPDIIDFVRIIADTGKDIFLDFLRGR